MAIPEFFPGATFKDLGPDGGPYDETAHPKALWHTTEGSSIAGAESAFKKFPPHLCYDGNTRELMQYVKMTKYAMALKGDESDDEFCFQIELVARAADTHTYSEQWYANVSEDLVVPLTEVYGVPPVHLRFYRQDEGIILASPDSPIRLTDSQFRAFSGHCGHQHVPKPDAHWDPGGLLMDVLLEGAMGTYSDDDRKRDEAIAFRMEALCQFFSEVHGSAVQGTELGEMKAVKYLDTHMWRFWRFLQMEPDMPGGITGPDPEGMPIVETVQALQTDMETMKGQVAEILGILTGSRMRLVPRVQGDTRLSFAVETGPIEGDPTP